MPVKECINVGLTGIQTSFKLGIWTSFLYVMQWFVEDLCSIKNRLKEKSNFKKICMTSSESCLGSYNLSEQMPKGSEPEWGAKILYLIFACWLGL